MLAFRKRKTLLQQLHPLSAVLIIASYLITVITINNPVYLILVLVSLLLLSIADGCLKDVLSFGRLVLPFAILMLILNPLISHNGNTIIYRTNISLPIFGNIVITLESIMYGLFMGIRIIGITMVFGLGNLVIHPDRAFGFFSKFLKKSALLMSMTVRFFPSMLNAYKNISDVEKLRGNQLNKGNLKQRMVSQSNIVNILFMSSIEDAVDTSESMYSRGYGIGRRSTYFKEGFSLLDKILIGFLLLFFCSLFYFLYSGFNGMNFYPHIDNPIRILNFYGLLISFMLVIPAAINWGWNIWRK